MKAINLIVVGALVIAVLCPCSQSTTISKSKSPLKVDRKDILNRKLAALDFDSRARPNQFFIVGTDEPGDCERGVSFGLSLAVFLMGFVWSIVQDIKSSVTAIHGEHGGALELTWCLVGMPFCYFIYFNLARKLSYKGFTAIATLPFISCFCTYAHLVYPQHSSLVDTTRKSTPIPQLLSLVSPFSNYLYIALCEAWTTVILPLVLNALLLGQRVTSNTFRILAASTAAGIATGGWVIVFVAEHLQRSGAKVTVGLGQFTILLNSVTGIATAASIGLVVIVTLLSAPKSKSGLQNTTAAVFVKSKTSTKIIRQHIILAAMYGFTSHIVRSIWNGPAIETLSPQQLLEHLGRFSTISGIFAILLTCFTPGPLRYLNFLIPITLSLVALPLFSSTISAELVQEKVKTLWTMYFAGLYRSVSTAIVFSTFDYNSVISAQVIRWRTIYLCLGTTCASLIRRILMTSLSSNMNECYPYYAVTFFGVLFVSFLVLLGQQ